MLKSSCSALVLGLLAILDQQGLLLFWGIFIIDTGLRLGVVSQFINQLSKQYTVHLES